MPELPEVETTVRGLNKTVKGKKIIGLWSDAPGMFRAITPAKLKSKIVGSKIIGARRRAKNILIDLSNGQTLIIHMKMTGHLMHGKWRQEKGKEKNWKPSLAVGPLNDPFNRFIHVIWQFDDKTQLAFCDMRKFGKIELEKTGTLHTHPRLSKLGPEPLEKMTGKEFAELLRSRPNGEIKTVLMDQNVVSGIGNIYSDEILWVAGVHPKSYVRAIPVTLLKKMRNITKRILLRSIKIGGDSKSDYRNIFGERGGFQKVHRAYRLTGSNCLKNGCGSKIERAIVGQRSAHFCGEHQVLYS